MLLLRRMKEDPFKNVTLHVAYPRMNTPFRVSIFDSYGDRNFRRQRT